MKLFLIAIVLTVFLFSVTPPVPSSNAVTLSVRTFANDSNPIQVLAKNQDPFGGIQVTGGYVYWINSPTGAYGTQIRRVSETGGPVQTIFKHQGIQSFFVTGDLIYWSTGDSLNSLNISTGKIHVLCTVDTSQYCDDPTSIQTSGNYVFFSYFPNYIVRIDTDGAGISPIYQKYPFVIGMAVSSNYLYWSNAVTGQVWRILFSGKGAEALSPNLCPGNCTSVSLEGVHSIILSNSSVFWTYNICYSNSSCFQLVNSVSNSGKHFVSLFKSKSSSFPPIVTSVAYYAGDVIFPFEKSISPPYQGKIFSVPASGGKTTLIAKIWAQDSQASSGYLYFSTNTQIDRIAL